MRWLEIIRLRTAAVRRDELRAELTELAASVPAGGGLVSATVFGHAALAGDLAVHLLWETEELPRGSRAGCAIAAHLRELGMVDHALWKEEVR